MCVHMCEWVGGGRQNMGQLLPLKCLRPSQGQHKKQRQIRLNEQELLLLGALIVIFCFQASLCSFLLLQLSIVSLCNL